MAVAATRNAAPTAEQAMMAEARLDSFLPMRRLTAAPMSGSRGIQNKGNELRMVASDPSI